ncbi:MAG TPA: hypothetical protein VGW35_11270 [Methylomirabilota bacterium]|nr:hypothetical protein [Methylomirabilota bacterium]
MMGAMVQRGSLLVAAVMLVLGGTHSAHALGTHAGSWAVTGSAIYFRFFVNRTGERLLATATVCVPKGELAVRIAKLAPDPLDTELFVTSFGISEQLCKTVSILVEDGQKLAVKGLGSKSKGTYQVSVFEPR